MDLVSFGAACECMHRLKTRDEAVRATNVRAAFHCDQKGWKRWVKQWKPKGGTDEKSFLRDFSAGLIK